jgi:hypothetical protein
MNQLNPGQFVDVLVDKASTKVSETSSKRNESMADFSIFHT